MIETGKANLVGKTVQFCSYDLDDPWCMGNEKLRLLLGKHYTVTEQKDFPNGTVICIDDDHGVGIALYLEQVHVVGW